MNPIFIVGSERSGSNLLRLLLNELPNVAIPHPPHLMRDLSPLVARFGDLGQDANFRKLARDATRLVRLHFAPWPIEPGVEEILRTAPSRTLFGVYAAIYDAYRNHVGKARWGCKSTFMIHHVEEILRHFPHAQFVHLVRDPRDVAVSARRSIFSRYHPYFVARQWAREQAIAADARARLPAASWFTLRYEDLLKQPRKQLVPLTQFLNEPYADDLLEYFKRKPARELSKLSFSWMNLAKPILKNNAEKYKQFLSKREIAMVESAAEAGMREYGYGLSTSPPTRARHFPRPRLALFSYWLQDLALTLFGEARALVQDPNARLRLRKRLFLKRLSF